MYSVWNKYTFVYVNYIQHMHTIKMSGETKFANSKKDLKKTVTNEV